LDDNYKIYYYISSDRIDWIYYNNIDLKRYFKVRVEFY